jgi:GTP diphosphokinase / guanosine-3',5'-bis(diphosphate) 3'-diphosphatase
VAEVQAVERITEKVPKSIDELVEKIREFNPTADLEFVRRAYLFSEKAHTGQLRRSGEAYISHPLGVAGILADLRLDLPSIATGLLHDTVEDTAVTLKDVETNFGSEIALLVDGVTKISQINFKHTHEKQGENVRKMIIAMGKDIRVVLVKLADRLHNMRTLSHMPYEKQAVIAQETLDIYAPLANRLGISTLKVELEDLSLRYLKPEAYYDLAQKVAKKKKEREKYIDEVKRLLIGEMAKQKVKCEVDGRPKHLYSIYRKMEGRGIDYEQVYDVLAFRVLVDTVAQCYEVLGVVHSLWKPIPGRFKDFIAMPKANNYQSLHTTCIGPGGERVEVQIRTREMHLIAERGIAAHWKYKEKREIDAMTDKKIQWLRDLVQWHQTTRDSDEFLETIKGDLFESEIYVFTPKGEVKALPEGATPLDFAYDIHTDVGNRTVGAKVNGRMVPLKHRLRSGDSVEIMTSPNQHPNKDWLKIVVTSRAASKIRAFVKAEENKRAVLVGKDLLEKDLRKYSISIGKVLKGPEFEKYLKAHGLSDINELYSQLGYGKITSQQIIHSLAPDLKQAPVEEPKTFIGKVFRAATERRKKSASLIRVDGMSDILVRYGKCCNPIPGDPIIGLISRGRGITVHAASCPKSFDFDQDRKVDVAWTKGVEVPRMVRIRVVSQNVMGILNHMTEVFKNQGIDIQNAQVRATKDNTAISLFEVNIRDTSQLSLVIQEIQKIKGIIGVERVQST